MFTHENITTTILLHSDIDNRLDVDDSLLVFPVTHWEIFLIVSVLHELNITKGRVIVCWKSRHNLIVQNQQYTDRRHTMRAEGPSKHFDLSCSNRGVSLNCV